MVFRPNYPFQMYPGAMRMPMQMPMQMPFQMPMQMPMQMSPQSFMPPGGFPFQPRIPSGLQMPNGLNAMGGQIPGTGAGAVAAAGAAMQPPSKIASFLQSADSLFNSAKTYTPYIQQAMPMMKNIPSLFKLYKGFQSLPDAGAVAGAGTAAVAAESLAATTSQQRSSRRSSTQNISSIPRESIPSKPRIFQPPM